ncbi:MAG: AlpA family phage regulatory protein [Burkholderiaceae bacterium]|nr:AlpA family phage regulatory protein [Burkholderiaceae bacterium]
MLDLKDALLRIDVVKQATGLSRATIYRRMKTNDFPAPCRLSARCSRWPAESIRNWIQAQRSLAESV